jgi:hypothetical protein
VRREMNPRKAARTMAKMEDDELDALYDGWMNPKIQVAK